MSSGLRCVDTILERSTFLVSSPLSPLPHPTPLFLSLWEGVENHRRDVEEGRPFE